MVETPDRPVQLRGVHGEAVATRVNSRPARSTSTIAPRWPRVNKPRPLHTAAGDDVLVGVGGDRRAAVVGAVEREVAQRGEPGLLE
jgi:hypothetical protein